MYHFMNNTTLQQSFPVAAHGNLFSGSDPSASECTCWKKVYGYRVEPHFTETLPFLPPAARQSAVFSGGLDAELTDSFYFNQDRTPPAQMDNDFTPQFGEISEIGRHWPTEWTIADIQKEEARRLVWTALSLCAVLSDYTPLFEYSPLDLFIMKQENVRLLANCNSFLPASSLFNSMLCCSLEKLPIWLDLRPITPRSHPGLFIAGSLCYGMHAKGLEDIQNIHHEGTALLR